MPLKSYTHPTKVHETIGTFMLADGFDFVVDLDKSHGSWLVDSKTGTEFLDMFSCFASMSVGWNHPDVVAAEKEFGRIALNNITNSDLYTSEMAWAIETISRIAKPAELNHLFFVAGGALAVENTLKMAMDWKVQKNWQTEAVPAGTEKGHQIAHFKQAFHGRSGYTMSITNTDPTKTERYAHFDWPRISNPVLNFPVDDTEIGRVKAAEDAAIAEIHDAAAKNQNDIAGIIIEPIQGEGGDNHFRPEFFKKLRKAADDIDAMLIFDEVQAGMGLTGKMWGYQHSEIVPDAISFGKKMQVCGMMAGPKVDEIEENVFTKSSRINSTWGGNLIDMVRGALYLEIIEREKLVDNAAKVGDYFLKGLGELAADDRVTNVRGQGLMCAFTLPDGATRDTFRKVAMEERCFTLAAGESSVRFRPMMNLTKEESDEAISMLSAALKKV